MKIKVAYNAFNGKGCGHVTLIAHKSANEDKATYKNTSICSLVLNFYPNASNTLFPDIKLNLGADHFITSIEVSKSFNDYVNELSTSKYNSSEYYDDINNNCVNAVLYALNLCDIKLDINSNLRCKHLSYLFFCPSRMTTPKELFESLMRYQYKSNRAEKINDAIFESSKFIFMKNELQPRITTPLLYQSEENRQLFDLLNSFNDKMSATEKQAAIYIIERYTDYNKNHIGFDQLQDEFKSAARDFRGSTSKTARINGLFLILAGLAIFIVSAIDFFASRRYKNSIFNLDLYLLCGGILCTITGLIALGRFGISRSLNKSFTMTASKLRQSEERIDSNQSDTDFISAKNDNSSLIKYV